MIENLRTGVGRIVWGNPGKPQVKKHQDGPNKGQPVLKDGVPVQQWAFGVAFPKAEFQAAIWPSMEAEARSGYPTGVPPRFSWKYQDGDGVDSKGKPFAEREGYAGCYILTVTTEAYAPPMCKLNAAGNGYDSITAEQIKPGDYVVCVLNLKVNVATGTNTPSLYVNPQLIEFVAYGSEIVSVGAVDPMAVLQGQRYTLPPGASAMPLAPVSSVGLPGGLSNPPTPPAPGGMPGMAPAPVPMTPPAAPLQAPPMAPPAPPAPVAPAGPARPVEPTHIQPNPAGGEWWFINGAWIASTTVAPPAPPPIPPAPDFVHNAGMQPPGMPTPPAPGGMPGMMPPR